MTKVLCLIANLAVHPELGRQLAAQPATADSLISILQCYTLEAKEELVLNAASTITNLSFYVEGEPQNQLLARPPKVDLICNFLVQSFIFAQYKRAAG